MRIGGVTLARTRTPRELESSLKGRLPDSDVYIVKPNWYSPHEFNFTDADALGMLLEALDGRVIVIEGYSMDRQDGCMSFTLEGERVDWRWLLCHPDWSWIMENGRIDEMRRQDRWFMDNYGFTDLFQDHGAEYVNVSEEIWLERTVEKASVKRRVESLFPPVGIERIYEFMPRRLKEHESAPLISLGRVKGYGGSYPSLTLKNMFGLIPDPLRSWWHGPEDSHLSSSIVDIAKLYASYFRIYGICEAFSSFTYSNKNGKVKTPWGNYDAVPSDGFAAHGPNLVELDAILCGLIQVDPEEMGYLKLGEKAFGMYNRGIIEEAKRISEEWLPLRG